MKALHLVLAGILPLVGAGAWLTSRAPAYAAPAKQTAAAPAETEVPAVIPAVTRNPEFAQLASLLAEPLKAGSQPWREPGTSYEEEQTRTTELYRRLDLFKTGNPLLAGCARSAAALARERGNTLNEVARIKGVTPSNFDALISTGNLLFKEGPKDDASIFEKGKSAVDTVTDIAKVVKFINGWSETNTQMRRYATLERKLALLGCDLGSSANQLLAEAAPSFGGVGLRFSLSPGGAEVAEVLPGTPAALAGLAKGDLITSLNGSSLAGLRSADAIADKFHGPADSRVTLLIRDHEGKQQQRILRRSYRLPAESLIDAQFTWNWNGASNHDTLLLDNLTGQILHDCCLVVELHPASAGDGQALRHFHFIREWKDAEKWRADYDEGGDYRPNVLSQKVAAIRYRMVCREFTASWDQDYGEGREASISQHLKEISFTANYRAPSNGFFGLGASEGGINLDFSGLKTIQPERVVVTLHYPGRQESLYWDVNESWSSSALFSSKSFCNSRFNRRPASFEVLLSFKGTEQTASASFSMPSAE